MLEQLAGIQEPRRSRSIHHPPPAPLEPLASSAAVKATPKTAPSPRFTNSLGMTMVRIEPGEFLMGSTKDQIDKLMKQFPDAKREWFDDEQPQHPVKITRPFYLAAHQVTVGQFRRFVESSGYKTEAEKATGSYDGTEWKLAKTGDRVRPGGRSSGRLREPQRRRGVPRMAQRAGNGEKARLPLADRGGVGVCLPGRHRGPLRGRRRP